MHIARSLALFGVAAVAEIGGAYLVWQAIREGKAWWLALLGGLALFSYGFVATHQPDPAFGRILAAYGGVFVAGSLAWGIAFDGFRPRPLRPLRRRDLPRRGGGDHVRAVGLTR